MNIEIDDEDIPFTMIQSGILGKLARKKLIKVEFSNCNGKPSEKQIAMAELLDSGSLKIYVDLCSKSIAHWNDLISKNPEWFTGFDMLKSEKDLLQKLKIGIIWIHNNNSDPAGLKVGFGGSWELDDEHGYGALMQNGQIIEVGHEDIAFSDESECEENDFSIQSEIKHLEKLANEHRKMLSEINLDDPFTRMAIKNSPVHPKIAIQETIDKLEKRIISLKTR